MKTPEEPHVLWMPWHDSIRTMYEEHKKNKEHKDFEDNDFESLGTYQGPVIITSEGAIPISEGSLPSNIFSFHKCHTNFFITRYMAFLIDNQLGIETLEIETPYRFRIAIGKCFNENEVKVELEEKLISYERKRRGLDKANVATEPIGMELLRKQFPFFAVVDLPDNKKAVVHGSSEEEVTKKLAQLYPLDPLNPDLHKAVLSWKSIQSK